VNFIDRAVALVSPSAALNRVRARAALNVITARYDVASPGNRMKSLRPTSTSADAAGAGRLRAAFMARDMIRNTPLASRVQQVIGNNVVGDGIIPKVVADSAALRSAMLNAVIAHFDTVAIDADGRANLYGLQRLIVQTMVESGEVLVRRRRLDASAGLALPFQIQVLEPDYLDTSKDTLLSDGNRVREGIEYDATGRRVAYWLFDEHPGSVRISGAWWRSQRVPATEVLHIYRQDRPGQMRGVSWFAPVAIALQDVADHQDAQLMRQKIAACFAGFRVATDAEFETSTTTDVAGLSTEISPGRIQNLAPGEDIRFSAPPGVEGYDEFTRNVLRTVAAGVGITYESLTGDLTGVNFSSARIGRLEMSRHISAIQHLILEPQLLQPLARWFAEAWAVSQPTRLRTARLEWVAPPMPLVDPTREIPAKVTAIRGGVMTRSQAIRELGHDPETVNAEFAQEQQEADRLKLVFDSDVRRTSGAGQMQPQPQDNGVTDGTDE
jgi:lambda family phage portal protein